MCAEPLSDDDLWEELQGPEETAALIAEIDRLPGLRVVGWEPDESEGREMSAEDWATMGPYKERPHVGPFGLLIKYEQNHQGQWGLAVLANAVDRLDSDLRTCVEKSGEELPPRGARFVRLSLDYKIDDDVRAFSFLELDRLFVRLDVWSDWYVDGRKLAFLIRRTFERSGFMEE